MGLGPEERDLIRTVCAAVVRGHVEQLREFGIESRLTDAEVSETLQSYGGTFTVPSEEDLDSAEIYDVEEPVRGRDVLLPLRTEEEGRTDLTLDLFLPFEGPHHARVNDVLVP